MIGVAVDSSERQIACEFFELLKTPWEFCAPAARYETVVRSAGTASPDGARLTIVFGALDPGLDAGTPVREHPGPVSVAFAGERYPVLGRAATFPASTVGIAREEASGEPLVAVRRSGEGLVVRVGYGLFAEIGRLLTAGQAPAAARTPTVELHIALFRELVTRSGLPLVEIPAVPGGHPFAVCLTHDIDHPVLRNHFMDATMLGYLYRATAGSLADVIKGRRSLGDMLRNWGSAALLPFVHLRLAPDSWARFDRYLEIEAGLGATYFFIPERGNPGLRRDGAAPALRASRYDPEELRPQMERILAAGSEVGLHGIDAWRDASAAGREREKIASVARTASMGVRMHWLYFDENAPRALDAAGFPYDSTVGYNETVGFRAGTTQAFRPLGVANLTELPLHVMDTALFYPSYLNLGFGEARALVRSLIARFEAFGGVLTINWHDRSLFAERRWGGFYRELVADLKGRGAWFPTAAQAVAWFRKRRSARFEGTRCDGRTVSVRCSVGADDALPALRLRVHRPVSSPSGSPFSDGPAAGFVETVLAGSSEFVFSL